MGWDEGSLTAKAKDMHTSNKEQGINSLLPTGITLLLLQRVVMMGEQMAYGKVLLKLAKKEKIWVLK